MKWPKRLPFAAKWLACAALFCVSLLPHGPAQADLGSWTPIGPADSIGAIAVAPSNNQIIYADGAQGLWKSVDGGINWSIVGQNPRAALVVDPTNAAILYGGASAQQGIAKSMDGGVTSKIVRPGIMPTAIAVDNTHPSTLYAGAVFSLTSAVFKSVDAGANWTEATGPLGTPSFAPNPNYAGVAVLPNQTNTIVATLAVYHGSQILRSSDAGAHWTLVGGGPQFYYPSAIAVTPGPGAGPIYTAWSTMGAKALLRSDDGGMTWNRLSSLPSKGGNIASLVVPGHGMTVVASINGISTLTKEPGGVFVSVDGGESWDELAPSPENVGQLAWAPTTHTLYVGTSNGVWQYTVPEIGFPKRVAPGFSEYYDAHDGWRVMGRPISVGTVVGGRSAQYFEKARIEDHTGESADPNWQFMYGLLVDELQLGGANLPVGGDASTVTYGTIRNQAAEALRLAPPPDFGGGTVALPDGSVFVPFTTDLSSAPGHRVAGLFWDYINRSDLFPGGWEHDVGLPITEPMDAVVDKGDEIGRAITIQAFQRTILTYDPLNPPDWQVERANVGTDYQLAFPGRVPN